MEYQKDELSIALAQMQDNLRKVADEHSERLWLQSGRNILNNKLRGDRGLPELSQDVIDFLAIYCEAQLGALYVLGATLTTCNTDMVSPGQRRRLSAWAKGL